MKPAVKKRAWSTGPAQAGYEVAQRLTKSPKRQADIVVGYYLGYKAALREGSRPKATPKPDLPPVVLGPQGLPE